MPIDFPSCNNAPIDGALDLPRGAPACRLSRVSSTRPRKTSGVRSLGRSDFRDEIVHVGQAGERSLPEYADQLSGFHHAFERELEAIVNELPLRPEMRALDLACGDGFYTRRMAERLGPGGHITGADINLAYLAEAREEANHQNGRAKIDFVAASFDRLPFPDGTFDFVWCAQSLYTLPDPIVALRHMARVLRPGGIVAVLENDTLHQVFLPWPVHLELHLRAAELRSFIEGEPKLEQVLRRPAALRHTRGCGARTFADDDSRFRSSSALGRSGTASAPELSRRNRKTRRAVSRSHSAARASPAGRSRIAPAPASAAASDDDLVERAGPGAKAGSVKCRPRTRRKPIGNHRPAPAE